MARARRGFDFPNWLAGRQSTSTPMESMRVEAAGCKTLLIMAVVRLDGELLIRRQNHAAR